MHTNQDLFDMPEYNPEPVEIDAWLAEQAADDDPAWDVDDVDPHDPFDLDDGREGGYDTMVADRLTS